MLLVYQLNLYSKVSLIKIIQHNSPIIRMAFFILAVGLAHFCSRLRLKKFHYLQFKHCLFIFLYSLFITGSFFLPFLKEKSGSDSSEKPTSLAVKDHDTAKPSHKPAIFIPLDRSNEIQV